jgi:glutamate synthase (ferredoxin)
LCAERDACGIGFVADAQGRPSRAIVEAAIGALCRVVHRGAVAADALTGDGAGILAPIPHGIFGGAGVAMVFAGPSGEPLRIVEEAALAEGLRDLRWREAPVDPAALGDFARSVMPRIMQLTFTTDHDDPDERERRCFRARRRAERESARQRMRLYIPSWSFHTITYKALSVATQLASFYLDLADPAFEAPFAIFHQRYSTNTRPSWERAQPFRFLCHNGEINAIQGNVNWMRTREGRLGADALASAELLHPLVDESGSDSAMLDNAVELLVRGGRDVRHAMQMLVPDFWEKRADLDPEVREFYRYHACLIEPWDGPAGLVFTDGIRVGACLDRNGLRPLRYQICSDGLVVCSSEVGTVDVDGHGVVRRGKLGPGQIICVDPTLDEPVESDQVVKRDLARLRPWGEWSSRLRSVSTGSPRVPVPGDVMARQAAFGFTKEELTVIVRAMATLSKEPTSSMGDDTAEPFLAGRPRAVFGYVKQRFAQVSNPAIDHLRERLVMSLRTLVGPRRPLLEESAEAADILELDSFFVYPDALDDLMVDSPWEVAHLDATFAVADGPAGLERAVRRLGDEAEHAVRAGAPVLFVSDTAVSAERAPVPSLLATGAVHHRLVRAGMRSLASIVVETGEPRETHHFACLLGYGADLICPVLTLATIADLAGRGRIGGDDPSAEEAVRRFRTATEDGVLKIMSKMGISTVDSYRGAQVFEAIGLGPEVIELCLDGTPSTIRGLGFAELGEDALARHALGYGKPRPVLPSPGFIKYTPRGQEYHATNPKVWGALHETVGAGTDKVAADLERAAHALRVAVRSEIPESYEAFAQLVNERPKAEPRDLLELVESELPVPIEEVEPAAGIAKRFSTGAMSHGSISREAHETLALAMNMIGGSSNTGEGGEDPDRYRTKGMPPGPDGKPRDRNSKIKQVASGRFGVTPEYCSYADELQIKIAQGSKPGEGGQLPGFKVSGEIARLRHTQPGVTLISPPPHHDIYSIEDLAQLIYDLKQVNPRADVSVKLVSTYGVGTIAAGVCKGLAEVVHISGGDGGTGASPLSSIKNAGLPWELGLAETQQTLVAEGLRDRIRVRVDGGFKTGRDVIMAALLGADEFSFGTAAMLAEGCILVRACHRDTCPVGIATQRPDLRERFQGTPEMVAAYMMFIAEEARRLLAKLGLRSMDEAIGRVDLLRQRELEGRAATADLSWLLHDARPHPEAPRRFVSHLTFQRPRSELGDRVCRDAISSVRTGEDVELSYEITNADRTVGAKLGGEIGYHFGSEYPPGQARVRFRGQAGQSFGAFLADGAELHLEGEACDYVGKGMGGGRIVITPPPDDAGDPHLIGNTVLYGATGGELYCAGRAGERFAVRNSGAMAVVEGVGMHACEYMTGGWVVILGPIGHNMSAGMTGGQAFVWDPDGASAAHVNQDLVTVLHPNPDQLEILRDLIERHTGYTGSEVAARILATWADASAGFWAVVPKTDVARLESKNDGLVHHEDDEEPLAAAGA